MIPQWWLKSVPCIALWYDLSVVIKVPFWYCWYRASLARHAHSHSLPGRTRCSWVCWMTGMAWCSTVVHTHLNPLSAASSIMYAFVLFSLGLKSLTVHRLSICCHCVIFSFFFLSLFVVVVVVCCGLFFCFSHLYGLQDVVHFVLVMCPTLADSELLQH